MASVDKQYLGDNRLLFDRNLQLQLNINTLQQVNILSCKQTCLLPHMNCNAAVMWCIIPPNRSPSFEVSTIFPLCEIGDIFANAKGREYDVQKLIFYCLWTLQSVNNNTTTYKAP